MRQNQFQVRINWGDTDMAGIVYYPNYFKWFDMAGHQFFRSIGLSASLLEKERNIILPLLDTRCTFENPLYYEDIITIVTKVEEINRKTLKLRHEVYRGEERTGHGYELRGWVKSEEGKIYAVELPQDVIDSLSSDEKTVENQNNPWLMA